MTDGATVDIGALMARPHLGRPRGLVVGAGVLITLFDGLDLQIIGLAGPAIAASLRIPVASLGAVFAAAIAGMAIGGLLIAPLGDRVGRKTVLVGSVACFGAFTLATMTAGSVPVLLCYRFGTGLGLGAAIPSAITLASEFFPTGRRAAIAGLLFTGFPAGGVLAGLLGARLIPTVGWQSLFVVGGVGPLVLAGLAALLLPESPIFLVARGAPVERVLLSLNGITPRPQFPASVRFVGVPPSQRRVPVRALFARGEVLRTLLLWAASFIAFGVLVVNSSWTPALLAPLGVPVARTAIALALFNAASVVATAAGGWLVSRLGARRVLPLALVVGAAGMAGVGLAAPVLTGVAGAQVLVGLGLGAASSGVIGLAAVAYPTATRSTGVGWALGVGRIGSFLGPLLVAALVAASWPVAGVFGALAVLCLLGALAAGASRHDNTSVSSSTLTEGAT